MGLENDSGKSKKTGSEWTSTLVYYDEAERELQYETEELDNLKNLIGQTQLIREVIASKAKMFIENKLVFHEFVVFNSGEWWFSIEKHTNFITLQRHPNKKTVTYELRRHPRNRVTPEYRRPLPGTKCLDDLIQWLIDEKELDKMYHYYNSNCQLFADRVYTYLTASNCVIL